MKKKKAREDQREMVGKRTQLKGRKGGEIWDRITKSGINVAVEVPRSGDRWVGSGERSDETTQKIEGGYQVSKMVKKEKKEKKINRNK